MLDDTVTLCLIFSEAAKMFLKEARHFTFQQSTLPAMYKSSNFSALLQILVIDCLLDYNHPSGCGAVTHHGPYCILTVNSPA